MRSRRASWLGAVVAALALVLIGAGPVSAATASVSVSAGASFSSSKVSLSATVYPSTSATLQESWYSVRSTSSSVSCSYNGSSWSCGSASVTALSTASAIQTQSSTYRWTKSWSSSKCTLSATTYYYYSFTAARVYMSGTSFKAASTKTSAKYVCS